MFQVPNQYRIRTHKLLGTPDSAGNNGLFVFGFKGYQVNCIASDGEGWEHVSVTINRKRTPDWETMGLVKEIFWGEDSTVIQYHPPKKVYVNFHPYCLHLWRPVGVSIPLPPTKLIGPILSNAEREKFGFPIIEEMQKSRIIKP
jgi:hypothetical protein